MVMVVAKSVLIVLPFCLSFFLFLIQLLDLFGQIIHPRMIRHDGLLGDDSGRLLSDLGLFQFIPDRIPGPDLDDAVILDGDPVQPAHASDETTEALLEKGIIKHAKDGVKLLGNGTVTGKYTVKVDAVSAGAKEKIEAAGGTVEVE